jgi:putative oxidoreductase
MRAFIPAKLAEVIFALIIAYFGYYHFTHADAMGKSVPGFIPGPGSLWIYITGAVFVLAAIGILADLKKIIACYLLAAMLLIFALTVHLHNYVEALKDAAMAMCALIIGSGKK